MPHSPASVKMVTVVLSMLLVPCLAQAEETAAGTDKKEPTEKSA